MMDELKGVQVDCKSTCDQQALTVMDGWQSSEADAAGPPSPTASGDDNLAPTLNVS